MKKSNLIKLKEMAEIYGCCEKTFRKHVKKCGIPHVLLGRTMLFDVAEVNAFLRERANKKMESGQRLKVSSRTKRKPDPLESIKSKDRYESILGLR